MSALWALVSFDDRPVALADLEAMSQALAAYGSEGLGLWREGAAGMGHRLMCFTPEDRLERQPLAAPEGRYVLVCDGRLDNRPELMQALAIAPADARQWPDSAFVLRAYQRWGEDCAAQLIGALAFVVWDTQQRRLFAASTPGNHRPLFYYHTPRLLVLATRPAGVLACPGVPRALYEPALADFLLHTNLRRSATFYRDLWRLPGGHTLTAQAGEVRVRRYWAPDLSRRILFAHDDDYVQAFKALFERVVSDHLRSLTPVAVMMSGGLDSSSVAATAARQLKERGALLHTFTEVPMPGAYGANLPQRYNDETPFIQAMARLHANLVPTLLQTEGQCFLEHLEELFTCQEAPLYGAANYVWMRAIMQTASQRQVRVVLTGEMGNWTISWGGQGVLCDYIRQGQLRTAWREARALARHGQARSGWRVLLSRGLGPLLPGGLWAALMSLRSPHSLSDYSALRLVYAEAQGIPAQTALANYRMRPITNDRQARYEVLTHSPVGLHRSAWRAQWGVDVRDPTGDQRLIEYCLAIPARQFLHQGQPRWLIRRAMADRLPPEILWNTQRGLQASDWFDRLSARRTEIGHLLLQLEHHTLARRALDLDRLRSLLEHWPAPQVSDTRLSRDYHLLFQEALMAGGFLLWFHARYGGDDRAHV
ncbi:MAG: asparagine synthase-related protein [Candidatus Tectimicrobiota bacterium]